MAEPLAEWTCPHGVAYTGSDDFVSGARNAHHEYEQAVVERTPEDVLLGFEPMVESDPWVVRRCPVHELVPAEAKRCPVLLPGHDVRCNARLTEPFEVRAASEAELRERPKQ